MIDIDTIIGTRYKFDTSSTPILLPKRKYKRPDLQALANRWYGMIDTGQVELYVTAIPSGDVREPVMDEQTISYYWKEPLSPAPTAPSFRVRTYRLPRVSMKWVLSRHTQVWEEYVQRDIQYRMREAIGKGITITT